MKQINFRAALRLFAVSVAALGLMTAISSRQPAEAATPMTVWVSSGGNDANSGESKTVPVKTIARAHQIVSEKKPDSPVHIRIKSGSYTEFGIVWTYFNPNHDTVFLPWDYTIGSATSETMARPVFSGNGTSSFWLTVRPDVAPTQTGTRIKFYHLEIRNSLGGISLRGRSYQYGAANNLLHGVKFSSIGSLYSKNSSDIGYAALQLINAPYTTVNKTNFYKIENRPDSTLGLIHAIYAAHKSTHLKVSQSSFNTVSGDPVRMRDGSSNGLVQTSRFLKAGSKGYMSDWYDKADEVRSYNNAFNNNEIRDGYKRIPLSATYCFDTKSVCSADRISASGNYAPR